MAYRCNQLGRGAKRKDQSLCGAQCGEVMKTCNSVIAAFYSFTKVCVCRQCPRSAAPGGRCRASSPWQSSPENTYSTQPRSDAPESPLSPSRERRSRAAATVNPPPLRRRPEPGPRAGDILLQAGSFNQPGRGGAPLVSSARIALYRIRDI